VKIKKGRYGPYISIGSISVRIPRGEQPESITLQRCFELMREQGKEVLDKKTKDKKSDEIDPKSIIREFEKYPSVKIINGRFGVYAMVGKKNIRLPKEIDIHTVSAEKIIALQIEQEAKEPVKSKKKEEKIASINIIRHFPLNPNVKICNGPKGPYVLVGKDEVKIPASTNPTMMSLEQCLSLHRLHVMDKARKAAKKATKPKK
jgi:DNA topoisomerase-1